MVEEEKKKLLVVEKNALRRPCKISRSQRIRNDRITEMIKLEYNVKLFRKTN